jgi:quinol monooxygenase YgiN
MKTLATILVLSAALAAPAAAQATNSAYLDITIVKVKPEKRADFDALAKKIVDANRKNHGDAWLAYEAAYGESDTVYFVSTRADMGAIDSGMDAFMKSMKESYGPGFESIFHELDNCVIGSRNELRRRRWDLSSMPGGDEAYVKYIGEARWIRTTAVRIRPGHMAEYEEVAEMLKEAAEKADPAAVRLVSQVVAGQTSGTYYLSTFQSSLGGFDGKMASARELLGDEAYARYVKVVAESVIDSETMIGKLLPALSNPPEEIVDITRDFWMPKPDSVPATRQKVLAENRDEEVVADNREDEASPDEPDEDPPQ